MISVALNFIVFQAAWFITILSASSGMPWYGPVFTLCWVVFHLALFTEKRNAEINLLLFAAMLGYFFDSLQVTFSVFSFPPQTSLGSPSTLWMVALWINLAATLNISLKWLQDKLLLAGLLGAIGGPAAYYAGSKLGALQLHGSWSLMAIALQWVIAMPLLVWCAQRLESLGQSTIIYNKPEGE
jgi:hypothetical protein